MVQQLPRTVTVRLLLWQFSEGSYLWGLPPENCPSPSEKFVDEITGGWVQVGKKNRIETRM